MYIKKFSDIAPESFFIYVFIRNRTILMKKFLD